MKHALEVIERNASSQKLIIEEMLGVSRVITAPSSQSLAAILFSCHGTSPWHEDPNCISTTITLHSLADLVNPEWKTYVSIRAAPVVALQFGPDRQFLS
jgi:hypothetical protein